MGLRHLEYTPPWEWPADAAEQILAVLGDPAATDPDRLLAVELGGDPLVLSDELARALLSILGAPGESETLRAQAAISFGTVLEDLEIEGMEDGELEGMEDPWEACVSPPVSAQIKEALQSAYHDPQAPKLIRRRALEASIRTDEEWHWGAVRSAYHDGDPDWKLTAVFCMRYLPGFKREILEALESEDPDIRYEAIRAAGEQELDEAWPHVRNILLDGIDAELGPWDIDDEEEEEDEDGVGDVAWEDLDDVEDVDDVGDVDPQVEEAHRHILLAAMDAAALIRPDEAGDLLADLSDSADWEIAEAALDAMTMAEVWASAGERDGEEEPTFH
jgi:hypothetical protein